MKDIISYVYSLDSLQLIKGRGAFPKTPRPLIPRLSSLAVNPILNRIPQILYFA